MNNDKIVALFTKLDADFSDVEIKAILIQVLLRMYAGDVQEALNFLEKVKGVIE